METPAAPQTELHEAEHPEVQREQAIAEHGQNQAIFNYSQKAIEQKERELMDSIAKNYGKIREVERELGNLQLQLKLTAGPKKHAMEMLRKKIETQNEKVAAIRVKHTAAKSTYERLDAELKKEEEAKEVLCGELSTLVQQAARAQMEKLEELKSHLESLYSGVLPRDMLARQLEATAAAAEAAVVAAAAVAAQGAAGVAGSAAGSAAGAAEACAPSQQGGAGPSGAAAADEQQQRQEAERRRQEAETAERQRQEAEAAERQKREVEAAAARSRHVTLNAGPGTGAAAPGPRQAGPAGSGAGPGGAPQGRAAPAAGPASGRPRQANGPAPANRFLGFDT